MLKVIRGDVIHRTHTDFLIFASPCPTTAFTIINGFPCGILLRIWSVESFIDRIFTLRVENRTDQTDPTGLTGTSDNAEGSGMLTHQCDLSVYSTLEVV